MHKTKNLDDGYMGSGKLIKQAIKKYGFENFKKEILFIFDNKSDMISKEREIILVSERTYNLSPGGEGNFDYINEFGNPRRGFFKDLDNEKIKDLCSRGGTSRKIWEEYSWKNTYNWNGKKHSEETKQKMRKSKNQGSKNSQFGSMWITNGIENKKIKKDIDNMPDGWYKGRI
jgi:hypothetical protein